MFFSEERSEHCENDWRLGAAVEGWRKKLVQQQESGKSKKEKIRNDSEEIKRVRGRDRRPYKVWGRSREERKDEEEE